MGSVLEQGRPPLLPLLRHLLLGTLALLLVARLPTASAWGVTGHEIVATIAQSQLHPDVRAHLCTILPANRTAYRSFYPAEGAPHRHCHLAPLAAWADRVHGWYPWSSHLHYVNPVDDDPPHHCTYGETGWQDHGTGNVLEAIVNYTAAVQQGEGYQRDEALRFLTHFVGDAHQPLHLTGRARGGNDVRVRYNGRFAKLHTVWDSLLLNDQIRDLANYTNPLPSLRIESALLGRNYDAYIRWIMAEGMGQARGAEGMEKAWWKDEVEAWPQCPDRSNSRVASVSKKSSHTGAQWLRAVTPHSSRLASRVYATIFHKASQQVENDDAGDVDDTDLPVCPYAWTKPMHPLVCSYAFAEPVPYGPQKPGTPLVELNVDTYAGRIEQDKILQRQLARAGTRLAAILNTLLLPEAQASQKGQSTASLDDLDLLPLVHSTAEEEHPEQPPPRKHPKHGGHHNGGKNKSSPIFSLIKVTASSIAEVVVLSSVGYILARQGILDKRTQTKINKVNVSFFTPSLLFSKVAFSLDPGRLAELAVVPIGFVAITVVSALSALTLSAVARLPRSHRNFSLACAITPNSNSLPVALMQSLVVTVPQLHWEEDGEPEDTVNGMLGRALTYLVLFSTLGMFLRWSLASQLLSTMEESDEEGDVMDEEPVSGAPLPESQQPVTGRLIDHDSNEGPIDSGRGRTSTKSTDATLTPQITVRRSTEDGGGTSGISSSRSPNRQASWPRSFPNSPDDSEEGEEDEDETNADNAATPRWMQQEQGRSCQSSLQRMGQTLVVRPIKAVGRFMTMPLYAALISLIVAVIPPLQKFIGSLDPLVGALETAGACSIPLTMVVLGAYFYEETDTTTPATKAPNTSGNGSAGGSAIQSRSNASTRQGSLDASSDTVAWRNDNTLVNADQNKRGPLPFANGSNPWKQGTMPSEVDARSEAAMTDDGEERAVRLDALSPTHGSTMSRQERRARQRRTMERRTIAVAIGSRMILTPILLLPLLAWYAISTRYNVVDDPVFICSACLLIGSPPALTLAQITSQSAKGSNSSFERLISKTIFVAYAIMATPTTILLVLSALVITENDH